MRWTDPSLPQHHGIESFHRFIIRLHPSSIKAVKDVFLKASVRVYVQDDLEQECEPVMSDYIKSNQALWSCKPRWLRWSEINNDGDHYFLSE